MVTTATKDRPVNRRDADRALAEALEDADNPTAAARALARVGRHLAPEAESSFAAFRLHAEKELARFFPGGRDESKPVAWSVLDAVRGNGQEPEPDAVGQGDGLPEAVPAIDALDEPPPEFLVDGLILQNETGMVIGEGGVYKTVLGLTTAAAVAVGEPLFGRFEVNESGPVLVVSEEDGAGVLRDRLEAIAHGHGWDPETVLRRVHLLALRGATFDEGRWRDHLAAEAQRVGAILAVLDPYSRLTRAAENSTDENKENIAFFSRLNREGVTVEVVHHAGKDFEGKSKLDRVRGASALNQAARWIYFLERSELGVAVECLKMSRAERLDRFVVEPDIETDPVEPTVWQKATFSYVTEDQAEEDAADRFILENLRRYPGTNSTGLKELAKGTGISAVEVSAAIRRLEAVGKIDFEPGPRNAKEWHLTDEADPAEKSSARSARYPADPAGTLPGKVEDKAAPCPSYKEEGRVGKGAGTARQGEPNTCDCEGCDACGDGCDKRLGPTAETCPTCRSGGPDA